MNKFTIIIPTYNSQKYIAECLNSAINQDWSNLEIIVVDNESTDDTNKVVDDILKEFDKDGKIYRFLGGSKQLSIKTGSAENIYPCSWEEPVQEAFSMMSDDTTHFMILASDDMIDSDFVSKNMRIISKNSDIRALQSPIWNLGMRTGTTGYSYSSLSEFKELCLSLCPVNTPTVVWDKTLIDEGMFITDPEKYKGAADYWMYCRQADKGLFIYPYNKPLGYKYRWNREQATWEMQEKYKGVDKEIQEFWRKRWRG